MSHERNKTTHKRRSKSSSSSSDSPKDKSKNKEKGAKRGKDEVYTEAKVICCQKCGKRKATAKAYGCQAITNCTATMITIGPDNFSADLLDGVYKYDDKAHTLIRLEDHRC